MSKERRVIVFEGFGFSGGHELLRLSVVMRGGVAVCCELRVGSGPGVVVPVVELDLRLGVSPRVLLLSAGGFSELLPGVVRLDDAVLRRAVLRLALFSVRPGRRPGGLVSARVPAELDSAIRAVGPDVVLGLLAAWCDLVGSAVPSSAWCLARPGSGEPELESEPKPDSPE